jgi:hypothetical protein
MPMRRSTYISPSALELFENGIVFELSSTENAEQRPSSPARKADNLINITQFGVPLAPTKAKSPGYTAKIEEIEGRENFLDQVKFFSNDSNDS